MVIVVVALLEEMYSKQYECFLCNEIWNNKNALKVATQTECINVEDKNVITTIHRTCQLDPKLMIVKQATELSSAMVSGECERRDSCSHSPYSAAMTTTTTTFVLNFAPVSRRPTISGRHMCHFQSLPSQDVGVADHVNTRVICSAQPPLPGSHAYTPP